MFEIGDTIHYYTFNGKREAVIVEVYPQDQYLCRLPDNTYVVVGLTSIEF